jgi:hypothetical protein
VTLASSSRGSNGSRDGRAQEEGLDEDFRNIDISPEKSL